MKSIHETIQDLLKEPDQNKLVGVIWPEDELEDAIAEIADFSCTNCNHYHSEIETCDIDKQCSAAIDLIVYNYYSTYK